MQRGDRRPRRCAAPRAPRAAGISASPDRTPRRAACARASSPQDGVGGARAARPRRSDHGSSADWRQSTHALEAGGRRLRVRDLDLEPLRAQELQRTRRPSCRRRRSPARAGRCRCRAPRRCACSCVVSEERISSRMMVSARSGETPRASACWRAAEQYHRVRGRSRGSANPVARLTRAISRLVAWRSAIICSNCWSSLIQLLAQLVEVHALAFWFGPPLYRRRVRAAAASAATMMQ